MKKSRKQRKLEAKQNGVPFVPQYNGTGVQSYEDYFGVGNERYNNKFFQFQRPVEEEQQEVEIESVPIVQEEKVEVLEAELVVETPKSKKGKKEGKLKKKLKKLFGK
ncbi:hypothetical protein ACQKNX_07450 [Lysinibacillus sp. NPDC093712]|uniref:hypothetical protein n=1 Tax=Lysinibacillus sp. NPDC093712 TaxID=3390579 RepID=UPI003D0311E9